MGLSATVSGFSATVHQRWFDDGSSTTATVNGSSATVQRFFVLGFSFFDRVGEWLNGDGEWLISDGSTVR